MEASYKQIIGDLTCQIFILQSRVKELEDVIKKTADGSNSEAQT